MYSHESLGNGAAAVKLASADDIFREMDARLRAGVPELPPTSSVCVFRLSGQGGGDFHIILADGRGSAAPGTVADPDLTLSMSAEDFLAITQGDADGVLYFLTGRITMRGDQSIALALAPLLLKDVDWAPDPDDVPV
jgi:hypothetical protein